MTCVEINVKDKDRNNEELNIKEEYCTQNNSTQALWIVN